jgi:hypothetical protein
MMITQKFQIIFIRSNNYKKNLVDIPAALRVSRCGRTVSSAYDHFLDYTMVSEKKL